MSSFYAVPKIRVSTIYDFVFKILFNINYNNIQFIKSIRFD
jgi:hypothetical protein